MMHMRLHRHSREARGESQLGAELAAGRGNIRDASRPFRRAPRTPGTFIVRHGTAFRLGREPLTSPRVLFRARLRGLPDRRGGGSCPAPSWLVARRDLARAPADARVAEQREALCVLPQVELMLARCEGCRRACTLSALRA